MTRKTIVSIATGLLALAAMATGCTDQTVCTLNFASLVLTVQDAQGAPVTGLAISDTVLSTGHGFAVPQNMPFLPPGVYVVLDDGYLGKIGSREWVRVVGTKSGTTVFTADFLFDGSGCHVRKLAGPSTVVVGS